MKQRKTMRWRYPPNEPVKRVKRPLTLVGMFAWPNARAALAYGADCRWWNYSQRPAAYKPGSRVPQ